MPTSRLSVDELKYRRSREYATKLYFAHLEATHQPKTKNDEQIDRIQTRLILQYPYSRLLHSTSPMF